MRRLLLLILWPLALAGCDGAGIFTDGDAPAFMERLDGTWTRTVTRETIGTDGSVTVGETATDGYLVARRVECSGRLTLDAAGDEDRIAAAFPPEAPDDTNARDCDVLTADPEARRVIFVGGGGSIVSDVAGTIVEDSRSRQVWHFYAPQGDGTTVRFVWTLTR